MIRSVFYIQKKFKIDGGTGLSARGAGESGVLTFQSPDCRTNFQIGLKPKPGPILLFCTEIKFLV
jgi:hypothetical protein